MGTGALCIDEIGYNSLEHLGACNRSCNRCVQEDVTLDASDPAIQAFRGRPFCLVGDVYQHVQPKGTAVYAWADRLERDPTFTPLHLTDAVSLARGGRGRGRGREGAHGRCQGNGVADLGRTAAGRSSGRGGSNRNARSPTDLCMDGYTLYRAVEDVFLLTTQQRQDNTASGRELTTLSQMFNGQRPVTQDEIGEMVDSLNRRAVTDLADIAHLGPRLVLQRNAPRHLLNTRLLQMAAIHAGKRLVVWNAQHRPVRHKDAPEPTPFTALDQVRALTVTRENDEGLTPDTWYFQGALYVLADTAKQNGAAAGACRNNVVRAVGLVTDPREPPDSGTGPYWRLRFLPKAVLVKPIRTASALDVFRDSPDFASLKGAFPVSPRSTKNSIAVRSLDASGEETTIHVRRRNVPLTDAYAVTDFFVQGCSFKDDCWVVDLCPPPTGIKRACLFVILTRFKSMDHVRLLRPLYTTPGERRTVIAAFTRAARVPDDLAAESRLQATAAQRTREQHADVFARMQLLVDARHPQPPAARASNVT